MSQANEWLTQFREIQVARPAPFTSGSENGGYRFRAELDDKGILRTRLEGGTPPWSEWVRFARWILADTRLRIDLAVKNEREACAGVADVWAVSPNEGESGAALNIAATIRARNDKRKDAMEP